MQPQNLSDLVRKTLRADEPPLVKATGFREYDARWWLGVAGSDKAPELNLAGAIAVGLGIGTYLHERGIRPDIVTGHDFRAYSPAVRSAVAAGLVASGCRVHDIGMGLSPTAYYAQVALDIPAVAMITASHNENGWTGVKMGCDRPLTFGPDEMARVKEIVLSGASGSARAAPSGRFRISPAAISRL
jgi:phosphomannomutase/phosphoglucomutase